LLSFEVYASQRPSGDRLGVPSWAAESSSILTSGSGPRNDTRPTSETPLVMKSSDPSGAQADGTKMRPSPPDNSRSVVPVPSAACEKMPPPSRTDQKTIRAPSGVHSGNMSGAASNVRRVSVWLARCQTQMSLSAAKPTLTTTRVPSGDTRGSS